jgi:hypothetical protein
MILATQWQCARAWRTFNNVRLSGWSGIKFTTIAADMFHFDERQDEAAPGLATTNTKQRQTSHIVYVHLLRATHTGNGNTFVIDVKKNPRQNTCAGMETAHTHVL